MIALWEAYRFPDFLVELHWDLLIVLVPEREYLFPGYVLQFATAFSEGIFTPLKRTWALFAGTASGLSVRGCEAKCGRCSADFSDIPLLAFQDR
jgi:hypothetical protein